MMIGSKKITLAASNGVLNKGILVYIAINVYQTLNYKLFVITFIN
jgi:hypothetical protein